MASPVAIPRPYAEPARMQPTQSYYSSYQDKYCPESNGSSPEHQMNRNYRDYIQNPEYCQAYTTETRHREYSHKVQESPPNFSPPSPRIKRGRANSMAGSSVEVNDYPNSRASNAASNSAPSVYSDSKAFKQILSAIARVQTNLSQQYFTMMELAEKQNAMQRRLDQSYGRMDEGVNRVIERTELLSDDLKDVRDQIEADLCSTIHNDDLVREITQKQVEGVSKILKEINTLGTDVKEVKAGSFADRRGLPESKQQEESDEIRLPNLFLKEIKDTIATEVKATVKSYVRAEMRSVKLEMMTELLNCRQIHDENTRRSLESKPAPDFSPQELLKFDDSDVTKFLAKYGFDKDWTSELSALQRKALLGCYIGKSHRRILKDQVKTMSTPGISFLSEKSMKVSPTIKVSK